MVPRVTRLYLAGAYRDESPQEGKIATEIRRGIERVTEVDEIYDGCGYYRHVARTLGKKISRKKLNDKHIDELYRKVHNAVCTCNISICGIDKFSIGIAGELAFITSKFVPLLIFLPPQQDINELPSFPYHIPDVYLRHYKDLKSTCKEIKLFIEDVRPYLMEERR